jgi:hypothetical protein
MNLQKSITHEIVLNLSKELNCPILELFYTKEDNKWYVCFEEYCTIEGKEQIVRLDDVLNEIKKYDNIEFITDEVYSDDDKEDTYFEQVTFQWEE